MDSTNMLGRVQLEFVRNRSGIKAYVNVFCGQLPPYQNDACKVWVGIQIADEDAKSVIAERFSGGQRVLLPLDITYDIINALSRDENVLIDLQADEALFIPSNFKKAWRRLLSNGGFHFYMEEVELLDFYPK
jgi:hypothetical protein